MRVGERGKATRLITGIGSSLSHSLSNARLLIHWIDKLRNERVLKGEVLSITRAKSMGFS